MSEFKSHRDFWNFERTVHRQLRYIRTPGHAEFLDTVLATSKPRRYLLKRGTEFWRAQLGCEFKKVEGEDDTIEVPRVYPPERMKPLTDKAFEGRVNAKGIPCLYLATSKETAMSEVRPWIGSHITVGQFKLLNDVEIIDCTRTSPDDIQYYLDEPEPKQREEAIWSCIDVAFAEPTTRNDDTADYAATQIIAELFRNADFGGVAYKSNFGRGYNTALFDINAAELIHCQLHRVEAIEFKFSDNQHFIREYSDEERNAIEPEARFIGP
jgi:hypothetical protein